MRHGWGSNGRGEASPGKERLRDMSQHSDDSARMAFCIATSERAGEIVRAARGDDALSYRYKHGVELVTSADEASDGFIRAEIGHRYPRESILSEEGDGVQGPDLVSGPLWVIDPLDGTV